MKISRPLVLATIFGVSAGMATGVSLATRGWWLPVLERVSTSQTSAEHTDPHAEAGDEHAGHDHAGHDHGEGEHGDEGHGDEAEENTIHLSDQARANLRLKLGTIALSDFTSQLVIPGSVVEEPGHSERRITTAIDGVVTKMHAFPGQAVRPGDKLLDLQPTGEVLTNAQSLLLKTLQDLELVQKELQRVAPLVESGSVPARVNLENEYQRQRLESQKLVQIQELLVRGLSPNQITELVAHKKLLREFTVRVPGGPVDHATPDDGHDHPPVVPAEMLIEPVSVTGAADEMVFTIERIDVFPGKLVATGDELCDLALHTDLYLEGHAFETDTPLLQDVLQQQRPVSALFSGDTGSSELRENLHIRFIANALDPATRTLKFYVPLQNEVVRDAEADNGVVYRTWRFKPGQKVQLLLPRETFQNQIVVPAEAVVMEGPNAYVFRSNGLLMDRVSVVVEQRDPRSVVLRNDGSLFPGDEIALNQAYQLQLALKKQQGAGVDMHAGHSH